MKKLFLFALFFLVTSFLHAEEPFKFEKILSFENKSQDELFTTTKLWINELYQYSTAKNDIVEDREGGIFLCRLHLPYNFQGIYKPMSSMGNYRGNINFKFKIQIKEGRMKVTLDGIDHVSDCGQRYTLGIIFNSHPSDWRTNQIRAWEDIKSTISSFFDKHTELLSAYINKKSSEDNW